MEATDILIISKDNLWLDIKIKKNLMLFYKKYKISNLATKQFNQKLKIFVTENGLVSHWNQHQSTRVRQEKTILWKKEIQYLAAFLDPNQIQAENNLQRSTKKITS